MAKIGDTFIALANAAGVTLEQEVKDALSGVDISIDDAIDTKMKTELMTLESAKHNSVLAKHHKAQALNAVDRELNEIIGDYGFEDTDVSRFQNEPSTFKRVRLVHDRVKELESSKTGGGTDEATVKKWKSQIDQLNADVLRAKQEAELAIANAKREAAESITDYAIQSRLNSYDYANSELDKSVNTTVAKTILETEMAKAGVKVVRSNDGSLKLVQADDPELDYVVENKKVDFSNFADKVLGEKKMLKVRGSSTEGETRTKTVEPPQNTGGDLYSPDVAAHYEQQLAGFK